MNYLPREKPRTAQWKAKYGKKLVENLRTKADPSLAYGVGTEIMLTIKGIVLQEDEVEFSEKNAFLRLISCEQEEQNKNICLWRRGVLPNELTNRGKALAQFPEELGTILGLLSLRESGRSAVKLKTSLDQHLAKIEAFSPEFQNRLSLLKKQNAVPVNDRMIRDVEREMKKQQAQIEKKEARLPPRNFMSMTDEKKKDYIKKKKKELAEKEKELAEKEKELGDKKKELTKTQEELTKTQKELRKKKKIKDDPKKKAEIKDLLKELNEDRKKKQQLKQEEKELKQKKKQVHNQTSKLKTQLKDLSEDGREKREDAVEKERTKLEGLAAQLLVLKGQESPESESEQHVGRFFFYYEQQQAVQRRREQLRQKMEKEKDAIQKLEQQQAKIQKAKLAKPEYSILNAHLENPKGVRFTLLHLARYGMNKAAKEGNAKAYRKQYIVGLGQALRLDDKGCVDYLVEKTTNKCLVEKTLLLQQQQQQEVEEFEPPQDSGAELEREESDVEKWIRLSRKTYGPKKQRYTRYGTGKNNKFINCVEAALKNMLQQFLATQSEDFLKEFIPEDLRKLLRRDGQSAKENHEQWNTELKKVINKKVKSLDEEAEGDERGQRLKKFLYHGGEKLDLDSSPAHMVMLFLIVSEERLKQSNNKGDFEEIENKIVDNCEDTNKMDLLEAGEIEKFYQMFIKEVNEAFDVNRNVSPGVEFFHDKVTYVFEELNAERVVFEESLGETELFTYSGHSDVDMHRHSPTEDRLEMERLDLSILPELELARDRKVVPLGPNSKVVAKSTKLMQAVAFPAFFGPRRSRTSDNNRRRSTEDVYDRFITYVTGRYTPGSYKRKRDSIFWTSMWAYITADESKLDEVCWDSVQEALKREPSLFRYCAASEASAAQYNKVVDHFLGITFVNGNDNKKVWTIAHPENLENVEHPNLLGKERYEAIVDGFLGVKPVNGKDKAWTITRPERIRDVKDVEFLRREKYEILCDKSIFEKNETYLFSDRSKVLTPEERLSHLQPKKNPPTYAGRDGEVSEEFYIKLCKHVIRRRINRGGVATSIFDESIKRSSLSPEKYFDLVKWLLEASYYEIPQIFKIVYEDSEQEKNGALKQHLKGEKYAELFEVAVGRAGRLALEEVKLEWLLEDNNNSEISKADRYFTIAKRALSQSPLKDVGDILQAVHKHLEERGGMYKHLKGEKYAELCKFAVQGDSLALKAVKPLWLLEENTDSELKEEGPKLKAHRYLLIAKLAMNTAVCGSTAASVLQSVNEHLNNGDLGDLISQHLKGEKYAELCELALEKVGHSAIIIKAVEPQWLQDHVDPESEQGDRPRVEQDPTEEEDPSEQQAADRYFNIAKAAMMQNGRRYVRVVADVLRSVNEHLEHFKDDLSHVRGEKYIELCRLAVSPDGEWNSKLGMNIRFVKPQYFVKDSEIRLPISPQGSEEKAHLARIRKIYKELVDHALMITFVNGNDNKKVWTNVEHPNNMQNVEHPNWLDKERYEAIVDQILGIKPVNGKDKAWEITRPKKILTGWDRDGIQMERILGGFLPKEKYEAIVDAYLGIETTMEEMTSGTNSTSRIKIKLPDNWYWEIRGKIPDVKDVEFLRREKYEILCEESIFGLYTPIHSERETYLFGDRSKDLTPEERLSHLQPKKKPPTYAGRDGEVSEEFYIKLCKRVISTSGNGIRRSSRSRTSIFDESIKRSSLSPEKYFDLVKWFIQQTSKDGIPQVFEIVHKDLGSQEKKRRFDITAS